MLSSLPFTTRVCDVSCSDAGDTESNADTQTDAASFKLTGEP